MRSPKLRTMVLALSACLPLGAAAALDEVQLRMLEQASLPLRWDNVEHAPQWVGGVKPAYQSGKGLHTVRLAPGQSVTLRLEGGAQLRAWRADASLSGADLELDFSQGSGLYRNLPAALSADGHGMLSPSASAAPHLVRVSRPPQAGSAIEIALFMSRREALGELAPYRGLVELPGAAVQMRRGDQAGQRYWPLSPRQPLQVRVAGPARYALEHRYAYPLQESSLQQTYRVHARLDGAALASMELETSAEARHPVYLDGQARVMGRTEVGYLEIPPGEHLLSLDSTAPLLARLLLQEQSDYLLASLNGPLRSALQVREDETPFRLALGSVPGEQAGARSAPLQSRLSTWQAQAPELIRAIEDGALTPSEREAAARRLVRDNARREGGLLGPMLMQASAARHQDYPAVQTVASELLGNYSFYRDLLPQKNLSEAGHYFARFIARDLHGIGMQGAGMAQAEQHLEQHLDRIPGAFFTGLPSPGEPGQGVHRPATAAGYHRYILPPRVEPSSLRLIVNAAEAADAEFFIQFDDAEPIRMRAIAQQELPDKEYAPAQGDAALEILAQQFGREQANTTAGPFSARRAGAKLIGARWLEMPLPSEVREVRAWRSGGAAAFHLAMQYRAAKPFSLSEAAYLELAARNGESSDARKVFAHALQTGAADEGEASAQELANHWLPLVRSLRSAHRAYTAPVVPPRQLAGQTQAQTGEQAQERAQEQTRLGVQAEAAKRDGKWLAALDAWAELARRAPLPLREQALLNQTEALMHLGEDFLAERQLRSLALYAGEESIGRQARARLEQYYLAANEPDSVVSLWSALSVQQPTVPHLRRLASALASNGEQAQALAIGLLLPDLQQEREQLLRAAYQLGWWASYQELAAGVPEPERRRFWQALAAMSQGRSEQARQDFAAGGEEGRTWLAALDSAPAAVRRLAQPAPSGARGKADLEPWQRWHSDHPGPFGWNEEAHLISDFAGAETLYSIDQDTTSRAYLATAERPLRLTLMGPVRLRIDARPLHAAGALQPLDGWLRLKQGKGMRILPISNNMPSAGLELSGHGELAPGRKVSGEFAFGPGLHEVTIDAAAMPVLLRIFARRPEMPIPLVPPLQLASLDAGRPDVAESALPWSDPDPAWPEAEALAAGEIETALALHPGRHEEDALRRMTLLLWQAEQDPASHRRALFEAEALGLRYPANATLQSILSRLARDAVWQPATGIQDSAGQRWIEVKGWQPESSAMRARRALMTHDTGDDQILSGNGRVLLTVRNLRSSVFELHLSQQELAGLASAPLKAYYQVDTGAPVALLLPAGAPRQVVRLALPAGDHVLRVGLDAPFANQFLRVRLLEPGAAVPLGLIERPWQVATRREPLRLPVAGPAWLRIDQLRNGAVESRYQWVSADLEQLSLQPSGQDREALLRVHQRVLAPGATPVPLRIPEPAPQAVPPALAGVTLARAPRHVAFADGLPLGAQEDGTWSYTAQASRRRDLEALDNTPAARFLQLGASHRYYREDWRTYFRTDMIGRVREAGGPVLAVRESVEHHPAWTSLSFALDGELAFQRPDGGLPLGKAEWSTSLAGSVRQKREIDPKSHHVPQLSLFARSSSMSGGSQYAAGTTDQDIYSDYRASHRYGLKLADTWYRRPWLDTVWHAGAEVVSKENFDLVHASQLGLTAGWRQLLGKLQLDASYQAKRLFSDAARPHTSNRRSLHLDAVWNHWVNGQDRLEAGFQVRRDSDTRAVTGLLYLTWHNSNGRGYRDFRPGELDFRDLRTRDIPPAPNNVVKVLNDD